MNIENIKKVRDYIAALKPERFNMRFLQSGSRGRELKNPKSLHRCGTAGCIAGWTNSLFFDEDADNDLYTAKDTFGITHSEAIHLFVPKGFEDGPISRATPAHAVAVLDRLIETGEVDWDWAMANPADLSGASS